MQRPARPSGLDRFLRLFADVRAGERGTVLLLTVNVFLILAAYYFTRPVREALILASGGAELKSYLSAGQAVLLLGAVPLYGALANRMPRRNLINIVTVFFTACLGVFYLLGAAGAPLLIQGIAFFLWVGIFNLMVVAQFWSFANDVYTSEEGERLFPIVAFGASSGAAVGVLISGRVIELFGLYPPLLVAGGILMASLVLTNRVDARERLRTEADLPVPLTTGAMPAASQEIPLADVRRALTGEIPVEDVRRALTGEIRIADVQRALEEGEPQAPDPSRARAELEESLRAVPLGGGQNPFRMVLGCPYLLMIALLIFFLNWVNTTGEYILGSLVQHAAQAAVASGAAGGLSEGQYIASFYSDFLFGVNILGLFLQLFVVSRVVKYFGVRVAVLVLPIVALGAYALLAFYPILSFVRWAKTAENGLDYSLNNTVRNMLFLPCTREQKYKAKQAIDAFFWRAGDVLSAALVFVGTTYLAMEAGDFAAFNLVLVASWLVLAVLIGREYRRLVSVGVPPCVPAVRSRAA